MLKVVLALAAVAAGGSMAHAATLEVGSGKKYSSIRAASLAANRYDTIVVYPGTYSSAKISDSDVTIKRAPYTSAGSVVITGSTYGDKGLLLITGHRVTVDGLTFKYARSTSRNGAGIRLEGTGLTVRNSRFLYNQNGMLVTPITKEAGTVTITNSLFKGNGYGDGQTHGLYVNHVNKLVVSNTRFEGTKVGHHLKSRANINLIRYNSFVDTGMYKAASYQIDLPSGGGATIEYNNFYKGKYSSNGCCVIALGFESSSNPTSPISVRYNKLTNQRSTRTTFVVNRLLTSARLTGNRFTGLVRALSGRGSVNGVIS